MTRTKYAAIVVAVIALAILTSRLAAQQVVVSAPTTSVSDSFFEQTGVGFGFRFLNGFFSFNQGGAGVAPPFGNDPNSGASFGFGRVGGGTSFDFNATAAQGSSRSIVSQTPSVTVANGGTGTFIDASQRPFVTGLVPVVGEMPIPYYPVMRPSSTSPLAGKLQQLSEQRTLGSAATPISSAPLVLDGAADDDPLSLKLAASRDSTAGHGDLSVAEIRHRHAALEASADNAENLELLKLIEQGSAAEASGKFGAARVYYQQAARRAEGEQRQQLLDKIETLKSR